MRLTLPHGMSLKQWEGIRKRLLGATFSLLVKTLGWLSLILPTCKTPFTFHLSYFHLFNCIKNTIQTTSSWKLGKARAVSKKNESISEPLKYMPITVVSSPSMRKRIWPRIVVMDLIRIPLDTAFLETAPLLTSCKILLLGLELSN